MVEGAAAAGSPAPKPTSQLSNDSTQSRNQTTNSHFRSRNKNASVRIRRGSVGVKNQKSRPKLDMSSNPNSNTKDRDRDQDASVSQVEMVELSIRREELNKKHREKILAEREAASRLRDSDDDEGEGEDGQIGVGIDSSTATDAVTPGTVSTSDPLDPEDKLKARNDAIARERKAEKARLLMEREIKAVEDPKGKGKKRSKISNLLHSHHHHGSKHSIDSSDEEDSHKINQPTPATEKNVQFNSTTELNELSKEINKKSKRKRHHHGKMPKWRKSKSRPSVMENVALRNQKALDRRDEERRATRASRFQELDPSSSSDGNDLDLERQDQVQILDDGEFENDEIVDTLDVVDPGVSAVTHLSNIANSIIFPPIPSLYSRAPIINLPITEEESRTSTDNSTIDGSRTSTGGITPNELEGQELIHAPEALTKSKTELAEISPPPPKNLDEHVKEVLRKRDMIKRGLKGVWAFVKTPLGVIAAIYGFLVVFFGAGLVLFLIGAVDHGKNKDYWVEVFSQGINALFTITGVGLIPWRLRDTYWMARICHYQHLTWRLRRERGLPKLRDCNDLPEEGVTGVTTGAAVRRTDAEKGILTPADEKLREQFEMKEKEKVEKANEEETKGDSTPSPNKVEKEIEDDGDSSSIGSGSAAPSSILRAGQDDRLRLPPDYDEEQVLSPRQADELHRLQKLFAASNSFYRPHETASHRAFPISWALGVTLLNDGNSLFQVLLCISMWYFAPHYQDRPAYQTACGIVFSFSCGIGSGVLIWRGGERTKKRDEVEKRLKEAFEEDERLDKVERELFEKRWLELMEGKGKGEVVGDESNLETPATEAETFASNFKQQAALIEKEEQKDQDATLTNLVGLGGIGKARD